MAALQEMHEPYITTDVVKGGRRFHTDNPEKQGELAAVVGLSDGCTEIIPLEDKRKLIGHKHVFDHTKENIKAASRAVRKGTVRVVQVPEGYVAFMKVGSEEATPLAERGDSTLHRTGKNSPRPRHVLACGYRKVQDNTASETSK